MKDAVIQFALLLGFAAAVCAPGSAQIALPAAKPNTVALTWNAPASSPDPVVKFNIYRRPVSTIAYSQVGSVQVATTSYGDMALASGAGYDYYVTSADASGVESAPSNVATAAIPFFPTVPINLNFGE